MNQNDQKPKASSYIYRSNLLNALALAIQVQRDLDVKYLGSLGMSNMRVGLETVRSELMAGKPLRMPHDNQLSALAMAVRRQREIEGPSGKSIFLDGLEQNLAALERGESLLVRWDV